MIWNYVKWLFKSPAKRRELRKADNADRKNLFKFHDALEAKDFKEVIRTPIVMFEEFSSQQQAALAILKYTAFVRSADKINAQTYLEYFLSEHGLSIFKGEDYWYLRAYVSLAYFHMFDEDTAESLLARTKHLNSNKVSKPVKDNFPLEFKDDTKL